jgi:hypothetical protein
MAGHIAAVLLNSIADLDGAKVTHLLVGGNEMLGDQVANLGV